MSLEAMMMCIPRHKVSHTYMVHIKAIDDFVVVKASNFKRLCEEHSLTYKVSVRKCDIDMVIQYGYTVEV